MAIHQPLDISYWFIQVFSGSNYLVFALIMMLSISILAAMFRLSSGVYALFIILFGAIMVTAGFPALMALLIISIGIILFILIGRLFT